MTTQLFITPTYSSVSYLGNRKYFTLCSDDGKMKHIIKGKKLNET